MQYQNVENGANGAPASLKITMDMALALTKTELKQGSVLPKYVHLMKLSQLTLRHAIRQNAKSRSTLSR